MQITEQPHIYRLQNITKHKLILLKQLQAELKEAEQKGWVSTAEEIKQEIEQTKKEAMHPQFVIDEIWSTVQDAGK